MTLRDVIISDATTVFCNAADFAETVVYYPRAGGSRPITAVAIREQRAFISEDGTTLGPVTEIHVANDSEAGISAYELDLGGDMIGVSMRDRPEERRAIVQLVTEDEGMLVLMCR